MAKWVFKIIGYFFEVEDITVQNNRKITLQKSKINFKNNEADLKN